MTQDDIDHIQNFIDNIMKRIQIQEESNKALKSEVAQAQDFITQRITGVK